MSQSSTRLSLPYIQPAQSQKHVTHNEAIRALDLLVQLTFKDDQTTTPPSNPDEGDCYVIPSNPVGVWAGQEDAIATYLDGAWQFTPPQAGWSGYVISRGALAGFTGTQWTDVAPIRATTITLASAHGPSSGSIQQNIMSKAISTQPPIALPPLLMGLTHLGQT
jgi:hypothetical protein